MSGEDIVYRVLSPKDHNSIVKMAESYIERHKTSMATGRLPPAEWIDVSIPDALLDGISCVAIDNGSQNVVGFQLAVLIKEDDTLGLSGFQAEQEVVKFTRSRESLLSRFGNVDLFTRYGVDRIACLRGLYVVGEYRLRGIGTRLRELCLELVRNQNIHLVVGSSNPKARRIFEKTNFEIVHNKDLDVTEDTEIIHYARKC